MSETETKSPEIIITRKIQIVIPVEDKTERINFYKKLREWNHIVDKGSNVISTNKYLQSQISNLLYLDEGIKAKIADISKDPAGILITSNQNSTYRMLSKMFKGDIPTDILTCLNQSISKSYNECKKDILNGKRSLMSYRQGQPIPFSASSMLNISKEMNEKEKETGNYFFSIYGIPFKTFFGKDRSFNQLIFDRMIAGEYTMKGSSLQFSEQKLFLRLTVGFAQNKTELVKERTCSARLDFENPIIAKIDNGKDGVISKIGNKEEFLYQRLAIQSSLRRLQIDLKYVKGGKGRRKLKKLKAFEAAESNYIKNKCHVYSQLLVKFALQNKCSSITLENYTEVELAAHEDKQLLLRNWSYYGLAEKIAYKAKIQGIEVILKEEPEKKEAQLPA